MEYYSAIKKNEIKPFAATQMQLEINILSEVSQKEKYKYHVVSLIWGIQNMAQVNTFCGFYSEAHFPFEVEITTELFPIGGDFFPRGGRKICLLL